MKLYLAGPMTGYEEFNFPAFHDAARRLREAGYEVFSPAEHDESMGFDSTGMTGDEIISGDYNLRHMLQADMTYICLEADGICLLPGWIASKGAVAELAVASALGLWAGYVLDYERDNLVPASDLFSKIRRI